MEMNAGQMVEDVRLAVNGKIKVEHYGRLGGMVHSPNEVLEAFEQKTNKSTGRSTYSAPRGANDDTVIARALMVHAEANMGHIPVMVT